MVAQGRRNNETSSYGVGREFLSTIEESEMRYSTTSRGSFIDEEPNRISELESIQRASARLLESVSNSGETSSRNFPRRSTSSMTSSAGNRASTTLRNSRTSSTHPKAPIRQNTRKQSTTSKPKIPTGPTRDSQQHTYSHSTPDIPVEYSPSRETYSGPSRSELEELRHELLQLKSMVNIRNAFSSANAETIELLESLPRLEETLNEMENNTKRTVEELHEKIITLTSSYRNMNQIASTAQLGISSFGKESTNPRPEWLPKVDVYDPALLQAEVDDILSQKKKLDIMLRNSEKNLYTSGATQPKTIVDTVATRIRKLSREISDFVDRSYAYQKHKESLRDRKSKVRGADQVNLVAPWMNPSAGWETFYLKQDPSAPPAQPQVPRVLKEFSKRVQAVENYHRSLAMIERIPEVVVEEDENDPAPTIVLKRRGGKPPPVQPSARATKVPNMKTSKPSSDEAEQRERADSFEALLDDLNSKSDDKKKESKPPSPEPSKPIQTTDRAIETEISVNNQTARGQSSLIPLLNLYDDNGDPHYRSLQVCYECACSIWTEALPFCDLVEILNQMIPMLRIFYGAVYSSYRRMVASIVQQLDQRHLYDCFYEAIWAQEPPLIRYAEIIVIVVASYELVAGRPCHKHLRESIISALALLDNAETVDLVASDVAVGAASAIHIAMRNQAASLRAQSSLQGAESTYLSAGENTSMPVTLQASIQARALAEAFGIAVGDLELSNIVSALCQLKPVGREAIVGLSQIEKIQVKAIVTTIARFCEQLVLSAARKSSDTHRHPMVSLSEQQQQKLKSQFEDVYVDFENRERREIRLMEYLVYVFWSYDTNVHPDPKEVSMITVAINTTAENTKWLMMKSRLPKEDSLKFHQLLKKVIARVDKDLTEALYLKSKYEDEPENPTVPEPPPVETLVSMDGTQDPLAEQKKLAGLVQSVVTSNFPTDKITHVASDSAVAQWFADRGEGVDRERVRDVVDEIISDIRNAPLPYDGETFEFDDVGSWCERGILEMVLHMYLKSLAGEVAKDEEDDEGGDTGDLISDEARKLANNIKAARLAVETTQAMVMKKEAMLLEKEKDLMEKEKGLQQRHSEMEYRFMEQALEERRAHLEKLETHVNDQKTQQAELERLRNEQIETIIREIGQAQLTSMSEVIKQITGSQAPVQQIVQPPREPESKHVVTNREFSVQTDDAPTVETVDCAAMTEVEESASVHDVADNSSDDMVEDAVLEAFTAEESNSSSMESLESEPEPKHKPRSTRATFLPPDVLAVEEKLAVRPSFKPFTSTLLNWSESDQSDTSSLSDDSNELSEGEIDAEEGDYSDGEEIPAHVAFQSVAMSAIRSLPWSTASTSSRQPPPKSQKQEGHDDEDEDGDGQMFSSADLRVQLLDPVALGILQSRIAAGSTESNIAEFSSCGSSSDDSDDVDDDTE